MDAHSHIPPEFVEKNVENFESGEMVSGGRRPTLTEEEGGFGDTLLLAEESFIWKQYCLVPPEGRKSLCEVLFHGAYRREVLEKTGGFREDLGRTEDNEFHYRVRENGYRFAMSPDIVSYQYIRPTLSKILPAEVWKRLLVGLTLGVCPGCLSLYHLVPAAFVAGIAVTTPCYGCFIFHGLPGSCGPVWHPGCDHDCTFYQE